MKHPTVLSLILAVFFLTIVPAKAGVLVEPLIGYNFSTEFEDEDGGSGAAFGGRLGYQNLGLQLGVDYLNSTISMDDFDEDVKMSEWAGFVGFEFPILFRVYAGYIFSANAETEAGGQKFELTEGSGTKVGVGFTGLPFVAINFEYRSGTFDEAKAGGLSASTETDYKSYLLSLSLPLNL